MFPSCAPTYDTPGLYLEFLVESVAAFLPLFLRDVDEFTYGEVLNDDPEVRLPGIDEARSTCGHVCDVSSSDVCLYEAVRLWVGIRN